MSDIDESGLPATKTYVVECESVIRFTREFDAESESEAQELAQMDAEDGQIGAFHQRSCIDGSVVSVTRKAVQS